MRPKFPDALDLDPPPAGWTGPVFWRTRTIGPARLFLVRTCGMRDFFYEEAIAARRQSHGEPGQRSMLGLGIRAISDAWRPRADRSAVVILGELHLARRSLGPRRLPGRAARSGARS